MIIITREIRSGEETSRNSRAYTERSPRICVRTIRLVKTLYGAVINTRWQDHKT